MQDAIKINITITNHKLDLWKPLNPVIKDIQEDNQQHWLSMVAEL